MASFRSLGAATIAALLPPKARPADAGAGLIVRASQWVRFDQPMRAQVRADIKSNPLFLHGFFREGRDHPMTDKRLGLSEREYACRAGITRGAVSKARLFGRLVLHPDGSIDAGKSDQRRATTTDPSQQRGRQARNLRPVSQAAVGAVAETLEEQGLPAPQASGMTFLQARTANEVLKARLRRIGCKS